MGKIDLLGGYYLEPSSTCYVLREPDKGKFDKNGKPIMPDAVGYYSTLSSAINGFRKVYGRIVIDEYEGSMSLEKAVELLTDLDEEIADLMERNNINDY